MRFRLIREMPRVRLIPSQAALLPAQKVQERPRRSPWSLLLLLLITAILIGVVIFLYYTRGPCEEGTTSSSAPGGKNRTTWTSALTGTSLQSKSTRRREYTTHAAPTTPECSVEESSTLQVQDTTVAGEQPQRTATYVNYALPSEPVPAKYAIIVTLTGSELVKTNVTSAVNISFTPRKGLDRIVLKAVPGASKHLKMALLERPNTNGQKALEVASVTGILTGDFMEMVAVTLKKAMTQGVEHVLSLEHKYVAPSAVASVPITRSSGFVQRKTKLDPQAVACRLGTLVETSADFESRVDTSKADRRTMIHQLAFASCVREGKAAGSMHTFAKRVLRLNPALKTEEAGSVSQTFRHAALNVLKTEKLSPEDLRYATTALSYLHLVRTPEEKRMVVDRASWLWKGKHGTDFSNPIYAIRHKNFSQQLIEFIHTP